MSLARAHDQGIATKVLPKRLINTHTLKLVDFSEDDAIPPYAILSHKWFHGHEISYQDYLDLRPETKMKIGYRKIQSACTRARLDRLNFIWIDTVCINQGNRDEVARNINSMYSYYQNSRVCYTHLADVFNSNDGPYVVGRTPALWMSSWFQRGWTLQELVAPREVIFLNARWEVIGNRHLLKLEVSRITGIPETVLDGSRAIEEVDLFERMAWCAGRQTTKPPDLAYCLLGILGVSLTPDYTEDVRTAFQRLHSTLLHSYPERFQAMQGDDIYLRLLHQSTRARVDSGYKAVTFNVAGAHHYAATPFVSLAKYSSPLMNPDLKYAVTSTFTPYIHLGRHPECTPRLQLRTLGSDPNHVNPLFTVDIYQLIQRSPSTHTPPITSGLGDALPQVDTLSDLALPRFELHMLLNAETWTGQFHLDFSNYELVLYPLLTDYDLGPLPIGPTSLQTSVDATRPAINSLRIVCDLIPQWPINLSGDPKFIGWRETKLSMTVVNHLKSSVTVLDIFASIRQVLQTPILHSDWDNLAENERDAVTKAYQKRCKAAENWEEERLKGVYFNGLLMDWENGVMKLVMGSQPNSSLSQGLSNPPSMAETQSREKVLKKISEPSGVLKRSRSDGALKEDAKFQKRM
ncbi:hypothetical protein D9758_005318 [Tetrapyrgos nigripes]|uniref:Heterokaryon incompatibility domain-containing protein n=1 Tax=Tetrapyrgos nigripes TaxID=182062 RepID=A0A8H5LPZ0_9AGAR|nr:hypothetical protein D9758_005318 [Tetrapyrgos nigripes]